VKYLEESKSVEVTPWICEKI